MCMGTKFVDLTGQRFGRLVVIKKAEHQKKGKTRWLCRCDCGRYTEVITHSLKRGATKSCGCLRQETIYSYNHRLGNRNSERLYQIWKGMKQRTTDKNATNFKNYGGRGITMCVEWLQDYEKFKQWAIDSGYQDGLSIERIDNMRGYCPDNCKWADRNEQNNSKRNNRVIEYYGMKRTISQWAKYLHIGESVLRDRLNRGWTIDKALSTPVRKQKK